MLAINPINDRELRVSNRDELEFYLRSWGFDVYDHQSTDDMRAAALENNKIKGPGHGPVCFNYRTMRPFTP